MKRSRSVPNANKHSSSLKFQTVFPTSSTTTNTTFTATTSTVTILCAFFLFCFSIPLQRFFFYLFFSIPFESFTRRVPLSSTARYSQNREGISTFGMSSKYRLDLKKDKTRHKDRNPSDQLITKERKKKIDPKTNQLFISHISLNVLLE